MFDMIVQFYCARDVHTTVYLLTAMLDGSSWPQDTHVQLAKSIFI